MKFFLAAAGTNCSRQVNTSIQDLIDEATIAYCKTLPNGNDDLDVLKPDEWFDSRIKSALRTKQSNVQRVKNVPKQT